MTADLIGHGRFGLNVVIGWNEGEFQMFGIEQRREHEDRYEYGQEWIDAIKRIWSPDELRACVSTRSLMPARGRCL